MANADRYFGGVKREDRYVTKAEDADLTLAVTVVRHDGRSQTFQTSLLSPAPHSVQSALNVLQSRAQTWFEETL